MKMLIDTNRYTDFSRNVPDVVARFVEADELFVPFAVIAELRAGFKNGTILSRNENTLVRFLGNPGRRRTPSAKDVLPSLHWTSRTFQTFWQRFDVQSQYKGNGAPPTWAALRFPPPKRYSTVLTLTREICHNIFVVWRVLPRRTNSLASANKSF